MSPVSELVGMTSAIVGMTSSGVGMASLPDGSFAYSGVVSRRWKRESADSRCDVELVIKANQVQVTNEQRANLPLTAEQVRHE